MLSLVIQREHFFFLRSLLDAAISIDNGDIGFADTENDGRTIGIGEDKGGFIIGS